jgi:hypothetical protein
METGVSAKEQTQPVSIRKNRANFTPMHNASNVSLFKTLLLLSFPLLWGGCGGQEGVALNQNAENPETVLCFTNVNDGTPIVDLPVQARRPMTENEKKYKFWEWGLYKTTLIENEVKTDKNGVVRFPEDSRFDYVVTNCPDLPCVTINGRGYLPDLVRIDAGIKAGGGTHRRELGFRAIAVEEKGIFEEKRLEIQNYLVRESFGKSTTISHVRIFLPKGKKDFWNDYELDFYWKSPSPNLCR